MSKATGSLAASIVVTAYNYENYVAQTLDSCLNQTEFSDFEVVVVNDGSTDGTADAIRPFEGRVTAIHQENSGIEKASNRGIAEARGRYIVRVDADDLLAPGYLKSLVSAIETRKTAFVYSNYWQIDGRGNRIREVDLPEFDPGEIRGRGDFLATGTLFDREVLQEAGGYDERTANCGLENYQLVLDLLQRGFRGARVSENLFMYRLHGGNISTQRLDGIVKYGREVIGKMFGIEYRTNEYHPYGLKL